MTQPVLELNGITKRFGGLIANDSVTLNLMPGEILALLGENGAGKTTLMNILFGHYTADEGEVLVEGTPLPPASRARRSRRAWGWCTSTSRWPATLPCWKTS